MMGYWHCFEYELDDGVTIEGAMAYEAIGCNEDGLPERVEQHWRDVSAYRWDDALNEPVELPKHDALALFEQHKAAIAEYLNEKAVDDAEQRAERH